MLRLHFIVVLYIKFLSEYRIYINTYKFVVLRKIKCSNLKTLILVNSMCLEVLYSNLKILVMNTRYS